MLQGIFNWFSKLQRSVTLSSAEAEYFGAMLAARDHTHLDEMRIQDAPHSSAFHSLSPALSA